MGCFDDCRLCTYAINWESYDYHVVRTKFFYCEHKDRPYIYNALNEIRLEDKHSCNCFKSKN